jgi:hypothetical protein
MRHFLANLDYPDKDENIVGKPDPLIVGSVERIHERDEIVM